MNRPGSDIRVRDEILELLYWLEGEGFAAHATSTGLHQFLDFAPAELDVALQQLVARGDVEVVHHGFRLTPTGRREAAHRFADDFAPLLRQGHGACNDPECDCSEDPASADCHTHVR